MTSIAHASVRIQTSSCLSPVPPPWFGEVALLIQHLRTQGILAALSEQVRFARRRFGQFEVLDFVAVLVGYAISGERTRPRLLRAGAALGDRLHGALCA